MKHLTKIVLFTVLALMLFSCNQTWEDHYKTQNGALLEKKLIELIEEQPDLSLFASMLKKTGYDKVLSSNQVYTVWAPDNAALAAVDTSNMNEVNKIVRNHIARFSHPSSGVQNAAVSMLNGKNVHFVQKEEDFIFGDRKLLEADLTVGNGILHVIDGMVTYYPNVWEYLSSAANVDSIRNYMYSFEEYYFDEENSLIIGTNDLGQILYDSIIIYSNLLFDYLGELNNEDSLYTMLFPDNQAWTEAYDTISSYFKYSGSVSTDSLIKAAADEMQSSVSKLAIVKDLIFRGNMSREEVLASDTLLSTGGYVFRDPALLFASATDSAMSNGRSFITPKLNYTTDVWCQPIVVEAENVRGRLYERCQLYNRDTYRSWLDTAISNSGYVEVSPLSASAQPIISFDIPNTLSTAYNIYCVFVPANVNDRNMDSAKLLPTKLRYTIEYLNASGRPTSRTYSRPALYVTNPYEMTKMLITQTSAGVVDPFLFNFCNYEEEVTTVRLTLTNIVSNAELESGLYTRNMLIDCIILEPVY
ncbi:MAG: fasciclin domain-containing protein [Bacteroidales bacterium]|nr:fasciclin domain-containing protein [Bacteroidales bacterium]MDD4430815.1 fasciclin domain-containing protein [Bacteroidales bacterium]